MRKSGSVLCFKKESERAHQWDPSSAGLSPAEIPSPAVIKAITEKVPHVLGCNPDREKFFLKAEGVGARQSFEALGERDIPPSC